MSNLAYAPELDRPIEFLTSLAQALSTMRLYEAGHPARQRSADRAHQALLDALEQTPALPFTFMDGDVILDERRLQDMRNWEWSETLADLGVERVEFQSGVSREEFNQFLQELDRRLESPARAADREPVQLPHIQYGKIAVGEQDAGFRQVGLGEEAEAVRYLHEKAQESGKVDTTLAEAVVLSIGAAIRNAPSVLDLMAPLKDEEQYTTVHTLNVSVLAVAMAESLGFSGEDIRSLGQAAVLHDVGKTRIPDEILEKPRPLTDEEWEIVRRHPVDGAQMLLNSDDRLDLAAIVAYEHHRTWSGGGYPKVRYNRKPHRASQVIQVCDVYDALRAKRPFRNPWPFEKIVRHIHEGSGERFDPKAVDAFARLIQRWEQEEAEARQEAAADGSMDLAGSADAAGDADGRGEGGGGEGPAGRGGGRTGGGDDSSAAAETDAEAGADDGS